MKAELESLGEGAGKQGVRTGLEPSGLLLTHEAELGIMALPGSLCDVIALGWASVSSSIKLVNTACHPKLAPWPWL